MLKVDMHAHWIVGIDDGARTIAEAIDIVSDLKKKGYTKLIATPHIMSDYYNNTSKDIQQAFIKTKKDIEKVERGIELSFSAEYYVDESFEELIDKDDLIPIADKYILIETSITQKPINFEHIVFKLLSKGYKPILAHPERYDYVAKDKDTLNMLRKMKEIGLLLQVNILSLGGYYGKQVKGIAEKICAQAMVDFLGTDIHNTKQIEYVEKALSNNKLQYVLRNQNLLNSSL